MNHRGSFTSNKLSRDTETNQATPSPWRIGLVNMPFSTAMRPSIQLGLLKATLKSHHLLVDTLYLNLEFAKIVGLFLYENLCAQTNSIGSWLFAASAFTNANSPDDSGRPINRLALAGNNLSTNNNPFSPTELTRIRNSVVPSYLELLVDSFDWGAYTVIGFTCSFEQTVASLALAVRLKDRWPHIITVFGGADFRGEMGVELVRACPSVDYAISGEGEIALCELIETLRQNAKEDCKISGVISRKHLSISPEPTTAESPDVETLPIPDYDEYFDRIKALAIIPQPTPTTFIIPYEASRGCWWGAKHQCAFCGLNGPFLKFRSKSPERILRDLSTLTERYGCFAYTFTDNIMDNRYFSTLLPLLRDSDDGYFLSWEVKANLRREQIRLLRDAGVRSIQPGIEALNNNLLKLMNKGTNALQNINTLRWGQYYGLFVGWNLLWGVPGETDDDYSTQLKFLLSIKHLPPPFVVSRIRIDRFSPLYKNRHWLYAKECYPPEEISNIYPSHFKLADIIPYLLSPDSRLSIPGVIQETISYVKQWQEQWQRPVRPSLKYYRAPTTVIIEDARISEDIKRFRFDGVVADLYLACSDHPRSTTSLISEFKRHCLSAEALCQYLAEFRCKGLMLKDGDTHLSLALPAKTSR
jgi:ribosomal peptide maturation radical SAM protein 1